MVRIRNYYNENEIVNYNCKKKKKVVAACKEFVVYPNNISPLCLLAYLQTSKMLLAANKIQYIFILWSICHSNTSSHALPSNTYTVWGNTSKTVFSNNTLVLSKRIPYRIFSETELNWPIESAAEYQHSSLTYSNSLQNGFHKCCVAYRNWVPIYCATVLSRD